MDLLDSILQNLSPEERAEYLGYMNKIGKNTKEIKLFKVHNTSKLSAPRDIAAKLYSPVNMNAYHSLRKRLIGQITQFIVLKRLRLDVDAEGGVLSLISMGKFMLEKGDYKAAAHFLLKAEQTAVRNRQYELLENIYKLLVNHAEFLKLNLEEIIRRWDENFEKYQTYRKLIKAHGTIRQQLSEARTTGVRHDPDSIIEPVLKEFNITSVEANDPQFLHAIVTLIRSALSVTKSYDKLESFIVRIYTRLKNKDAFGGDNSEIELSFLYMIAHTLYRKRKFDEAANWLEKLEQVLPKKRFRSSKIYTRHVSLKAAITCYSGHNEDAIRMTEKVLEGASHLSDMREKLNMRLNLVVYYFNANEFKKANKALINIGYSDKWLDENMGKEWRFKKNLIEIIVQFELGNVELAHSRLIKMQRYFAAHFNHPSYQSAGVFMKFVGKMIDNPDAASSPEFIEAVKQTKMGVEDLKGDIQAVTFYCWLRSKMLKQPYYEVLLDRLKNG